MTKPTPPKKTNATKPTIKVRESTYRKLRSAARRSGEQIGTLTDAIVNRWLDEQEKTN